MWLNTTKAVFRTPIDSRKSIDEFSAVASSYLAPP